MTWLKRFDSRHSLLNMYNYVTTFNGKSVGTENKNALIVSNGNKVTFYRLSEENNKLKTVWKRKYLDSSYMNERFDWVKNTLLEAELLIKKTENNNFASLTNKELYLLYIDYVNIFQKIFEGYNMSQPEVPKVCEDELQRVISEKIKDNKQASEIFLLITTPTKSTPLMEEELNWLETLLKVKKYGLNETLNKIKDHSLKFGWISTQESLSFLDTEYYTKLAKQNNEEVAEICRKIKELYEKQRKIEAKRKKTLEELKNKRISDYSEILREAGHLRILKRLAWTKLEYSFTGFFSELGKRIGLDNKQIKYLFPDEVRKCLLLREQISERMVKHVIHMDNGKLKFYTGKKAKEIEDSIIEKETNQNEVKGTCASPGFVTGRAKIIHSHLENQQEEVEKMQKGDILVAGSTKPQLILACQKASAIVTDEGGITSHAAIVSREFGIPCVVGTGSATKIFHDGDIIEVDANKGTVRKLNK